MANPLQAAGAISEPSKFAPIHTNRFFTGLWTQRNPLRDAATPYLYEKFYSGSRFDSLIDGSNTELSSRLTLRRRPGHSVYNSQTFPAINRFYGWRQLVTGSESIRLIADTAATVYDATGPNTKTTILSKTAGAGSTYFQGVGKFLYMGNGVDLNKWDGSALTGWGIDGSGMSPFIAFANGWVGGAKNGQGLIIIDPNGNFQCACVNFRNSSVTPPADWATVAGKTTPDRSQLWINTGSTSNRWQASFTIPYTSPAGVGSGAGAITYFGYCIVDSNNNIQQVQNATTAGIATGASVPTWNTTLGGTTTDGTVVWVNAGPYGKPFQSGYQYAAAYHLTSGAVSSAQLTTKLLYACGSMSATIEGLASARPDCDAIWIFRTPDGGSTFEFLASIANPGSGLWTYTDTNDDAALNPFILAPINKQNDPPPTGLINLAYHLGRVWGSVGNTLYYSQGPAVLTGSGDEAFAPTNYFLLPSIIKRVVPTAIGLLVFTTSKVYLVLGNGTTSSQLYIVPYLDGVGLSSYDALDVNGTTIYAMLPDAQVVALDPGSGLTEIGFPIGDQFQASYNPASSYMAWHQGGSSDKALFVSDGATGWFRMSPTSAPESGFAWSPKAAIVGGCSAVQSIEVASGVRRLLVGPQSSGPILQRDLTVNTDNGTAFVPKARVGSIVLAQPGQLAELSFFTCDSVALGTRPTLGLLLGEISGTLDVLTRSCADPPLLPASTTLYSDRYYMGQNQQSAWCRHLQLEFAWAAEDAATELLTYTLYGAIHQER